MMKYGGDEKKRGAFLLGNGHSDQNLGSRDGGQRGGGYFTPKFEIGTNLLL